MGESRRVKLLVQPGSGVLPLIKGIQKAKKSVEIAIFRFDQREIERALANAVSRGVSVQALIAHTNRAGEENLRQLEQRLLADGVTVARTADDLVRYHAKYMIIDHQELHVLAFNFTALDIDRSRSFGAITRNRSLVAEASKLFEADSQRQPYEPGSDGLVVSPVNARARLAALIKSAKKEVILYDPKVSDQGMIRLLDERGKAGVKIRIIGHLTRKIAGAETRKLPDIRLHTRTMVVDGRRVFIGSQSLRELELDARREVGVIFNDSKLAGILTKVFENDWARTEKTLDQCDKPPAEKVAKKVAKVLARDMPQVMPVLNGVVKDVVGEDAELELNARKIEKVVKAAVKDAVKEALNNAVEEVAEQSCRAAEKTGQ